jgi:flagella basal body P-ring formation protein FlgA
MRLHVPQRRLKIAVALVLALCANVGAQDRISLRPAASISGNVVRLGDVADVQGPAMLAEVVIVKDLRSELGQGGEAATIDLARVRSALEKVPTVNWGRLTLSGVPCRVKAATMEAPGSTPERELDASPDEAAPTLRDQVVSWLAHAFACSPEDLRVTFDDAQSEALDASVVGLATSIRSLGSSDKLSLAMTTYRGDVITNSLTIRVAPLIRREVAVASRRIARGEPLTSDVLRTDEQWVPPSVVPIDARSLHGVIARTRIDAGTIIRHEHIDQPIVIKKGEIVTVDCVSGGIVVRAMARAMSAARDGEIIAFQYLESKRSFNARANGPGRAVIVVDGEPEEGRAGVVAKGPAPTERPVSVQRTGDLP